MISENKTGKARKHKMAWLKWMKMNIKETIMASKWSKLDGSDRRVRNEEVKLSLLTDNMIIYIDNLHK